MPVENEPQRLSRFIGLHISETQFETLTKLQNEIALREGATRRVALSELIRRAINSYADCKLS